MALGVMPCVGDDLMKHMLGALIAFLVIILVAVGASACSVSISALSADSRGDNSSYFYNSISSAKSNDIDLRTQFNIDSYSGSDCPANITAKYQIYRYNSSTSAWESYTTASTKSQGLSLGNFVFVWDNIFNTGSNSKYLRFKAVTTVLNGTEVLDTAETYIDVIDNSCSSVKLVVGAITIDEARTNSRSFTIQNNTDTTFEVSNASMSATSSIIRGASIDYSITVPSHSSRSINFTIDAGTVSTDTTTTGTFFASGYLGSTFCSTSDLGQKNFDITVKNTGSDDSYYYDSYYSTYSTSSDCADMVLEPLTAAIWEGTNEKITMNLKNNSAKRFEVTEVTPTSNNIQLNDYYNDKYIYPGQIGGITIEALAPNVTSDSTYANNVRIRGKFADGRTCSINDINSVLTTKILNITPSISTSGTCSDFSMSVPESVSITGNGSIPFSISNFTNSKADIYVEGTVDAAPTIITLPNGTALTNQINVSTNAPNATIVLRPVIEGCNPQAKTITITNNASGTFSSIKITPSATRDANGAITLGITIDNPTAKPFSGVLSASTPNGWSNYSQSITVQSGKNYFETKLNPSNGATEGNIIVKFASGGQEITANTATNANTSGTFAAMFTLGSSQGTIGVILLVIIVIVLLAAMISAHNSRRNMDEQGQRWAK